MKGISVSRRGFMQTMATAAAGIALAHLFDAPLEAAAYAHPSATAEGHAILELDVKCGDVPANAEFYGNTLGLPVKSLDEGGIEVQAGVSVVRFHPAPPELGMPMYHICFNIPENKIEQARDWLAARTKLIERNGDPIIHFTTRNADSLYFFDPAGNLMEFMAPHRIANATSGPFSQREVLNTSEIGIVVDDVHTAVGKVEQETSLRWFLTQPQPGGQFARIGDDHGMLIVVPKERHWLLTDIPAKAYPLSARMHGSQSATYAFGDLPYVLSVG